MLVLASVRVTTRARPLAKLWLQTRTIKSAPVLSAATETSSAGVPTWRSTVSRSRREREVPGEELLIPCPRAVWLVIGECRNGRGRMQMEHDELGLAAGGGIDDLAERAGGSSLVPSIGQEQPCEQLKWPRIGRDEHDRRGRAGDDLERRRAVAPAGRGPADDAAMRGIHASSRNMRPVDGNGTCVVFEGGGWRSAPAAIYFSSSSRLIVVAALCTTLRRNSY